MLRERGLEVDVWEAPLVQALTGHDGVIVAGSIYAGRWHPDAKAFIKRFEHDLASRRVAIFAMGPKTSEPDDIASAHEQLDLNLKRLPDVGAEPIAVFGGVIRPEKLHFPFSRLPETDARDWEAISSFADAYAARFAAVPVG
jgi:menaquinone-dependent protoporphyrinogen IX oxidase